MQNFDITKMSKPSLLTLGPTQGPGPKAKVADIKRNATEIWPIYKNNLLSGYRNMST